jgi:hypothetical protein
VSNTVYHLTVKERGAPKGQTRKFRYTDFVVLTEKEHEAERAGFETDVTIVHSTKGVK